LQRIIKIEYRFKKDLFLMLNPLALRALPPGEEKKLDLKRILLDGENCRPLGGDVAKRQRGLILPISQAFLSLYPSDEE
jgi:hypothetical protein